MYAYSAQGPDEIDVEVGALIQLTEGPNGGRNYADGWWEGKQLRRGRRAFVLSETDGAFDHDVRDRRKWEEGHLPK